MYIYIERERERDCVCVYVSVDGINDRESVWRDRDCEDIERECVCSERER